MSVSTTTGQQTHAWSQRGSNMSEDSGGGGSGGGSRVTTTRQQIWDEAEIIDGILDGEKRNVSYDPSVFPIAWQRAMIDNRIKVWFEFCPLLQYSWHDPNFCELRWRNAGDGRFEWRHVLPCMSFDQARSIKWNLNGKITLSDKQPSATFFLLLKNHAQKCAACSQISASNSSSASSTLDAALAVSSLRKRNRFAGSLRDINSGTSMSTHHVPIMSMTSAPPPLGMIRPPPHPSSHSPFVDERLWMRCRVDAFSWTNGHCPTLTSADLHVLYASHIARGMRYTCIEPPQPGSWLFSHPAQLVTHCFAERPVELFVVYQDDFRIAPVVDFAYFPGLVVLILTWLSRDTTEDKRPKIHVFSRV